MFWFNFSSSYHHPSADNGLLALQRDQAVPEVNPGDALAVRLDVAQVADVSGGVPGRAVTAPGGIVVRAHAGAAVRGVAELVHVKAVLARRQAAHLAHDVHCALLDLKEN